MDLINDGILWKFICEKLQNADPVSFSGVHFESDGDTIYCDDERGAEIVADFLEKIGFDDVHTGERYEGSYYIRPADARRFLRASAQ